MSLATADYRSSVDNPGDWLPLDQAAALIGDCPRTMRHRAISQWMKAGLAEFRPSGPGRGRPAWWVHRSVHPRLARHLAGRTPAEHVRDSLLADHPWHAVKRACRKSFWVDKWRKLCNAPRQPGQTNRSLAARVVAEARRVEGRGFKISVRSLQAWWHNSRKPASDGQSLGVRALIDKHRGPCGVGGGETLRSAAAIRYFYSLYHAQPPRSVRICHDATLREATRQAWSWPPGYTATTRWLRDNDDLSLSFLMRRGRTRWCHRFMPHLEMDWAAVEPGEFFVCDHTQCDFWVIHERRQIRPWLTAVQDCRSRCITGWHLGPAPHADAIAASLRAAFTDWAIPRVMRVDNGKDFCSKYITGLTKSEVRILKRTLGPHWKDIIRRDLNLVDFDDRWLGITGELGIELIYAIPYAPWSKGTLERWFGTYEDQCAKDFITYCGSSPATRPEHLDELRRGAGRRTKKGLKLIDAHDVPTMDDARGRIADYLERYHHARHRGLGVDGSTPLAVWRSAANLRKAENDALLFLMHVRGAYDVGANGVSLTIGGARITYGAASPALRRWKGRKILVAVDPDRVDCCWALECKSRRLITRCEANKRIHPCASTDDVRAAVAASQRDKSVMHKAARSAASRTRTMTRRINAANRERLAELRKTGTADADAPPGLNIALVRTGLERLSIPDRTTFDAAAFEPSDPGDIEDLFDDDFDRVDSQPDRDDEIEDLFDDAVDSPPAECPEDDPECLFLDESVDGDDSADDGLGMIL